MAGLDRTSTRGAGLALTPAPGGAHWRVPGTQCWWPCSPVSAMDGVAEPGIRLPDIPSPPGVGGMEWYGRSQVGQSVVVDLATGWGSVMPRPRVLTAPDPLTPAGGLAPGSGCARRAARRR